MLNNKNIYLTLFIISCLLESIFIYYKQEVLVLTFRVISICILFLYYLTSVNKINTNYIITVTLFLITDTLFSLERYYHSGMLPLVLSRIFLIIITLKSVKAFDYKQFSKIVLMFSVLAFIIFFSLNIKKDLLYISMLVALTLIILGSLVFMNLLNSRKKGNLEMFLGVFLFIISDAIFGVQKIDESNYKLPVFTTIVYNIAYYLICKAIIKKE